jgi:NADPH2:quinone reductase
MENGDAGNRGKDFLGLWRLRQTELPKPQPAEDRVLVRVTAAGVTPLDHTILSGGHPRAKAPLVLGNEGAGVIEDAGGSGLAEGSRVMFTGLYGVAESGAWQDWLLVRPEHLALVPDAIDDVVAASLPVAYLTAARNDASALPFWPCGGPTKRGAHPFF